MRGVTIRTSSYINRRLNLGWKDMEEMITECKPRENPAMKAVLGLQAITGTVMGSMAGWSVAHLNPVDLPGKGIGATVAEVGLNTAVYAPMTFGTVMFLAVGVEAAANIRHVGENYVPPESEANAY